MSIFVRIWFGFSLVLLIGSFFILSSLQQQIKPNIRQVVEDTLADNANMIAALVADDIANGIVQTPEFDQKMQATLSRVLDAKIWNMQKSAIHQNVYITDQHGRVIYDSTGQYTGQDFSRWNDIYLTLRGQYGVRSTRTDPRDENSSAMYVAAPVIYHNELIGVVSLGKKGQSVQPYIEAAQHQMLIKASIVVVFSLLLCGFVAWWLKRSIEKVRQYALALAANRQQQPYFYSARELNDLAHAITTMRQQLEDRAYVEHYVHTLTHELKSPLTAIHASAELLEEALPPDDQQYFARQIQQQTHRLQDLVERLLLLAKLEKTDEDFELQTVDLKSLMQNSLAQRKGIIQQRQIEVQTSFNAACLIQAEPFWLGQALANLLDNAISFTPAGKTLTIALEHSAQQLVLNIINQGPAIPDYALSHIFERYYSLPRPDTGLKSTGLGLTLVKEVLDKHQATITIENRADGVAVSIYFSA
ncbi:two-component system sensor histidine kinase CreC [Alkanindiges illinoisensis]|uniref:two-component system sensor histidine kinase CreC n=1 Tax=Alkanindiges illinoisensis TaxID=197183 RepID=UPI000684B134|nr:two-component system sensor histidine kinase CreC [Alkanindiges illinoisensis]